MSRSKLPTPGIEALDRVWRTTATMFQHLASLSPAERERVVAEINAHWQALPVVAAVGGGTEEEPATLFEGGERVPQMPPLRGAERTAA